ncbi:D-2-hydroxyacid dehydrogenase [Lachnospiraceae bacterium 54-53]
MKTEVMVCPGLPLTETHKEILMKALPETHITFYSKEPSQEDFEHADFIFGNPPFDKLKHCPKLKLLQLRSAGAHGYFQALPQGAKLVNAKGAYGLAVSEHMIALTLAAMKKIHLYMMNQQDCVWRDEGRVSSISESTVLVIGAGDIGTDYGGKMKALGAKTMGICHGEPKQRDGLDEIYSRDKLDEVLGQADIVALCLPETPETCHIINKERISLMKPSAVLINAGRGTAIDQEALCDALDGNRLAAAGLDVTTPEPLPSDHRLWKTPNLIITPHVSGGAHLPSTVTRIVEIAACNFRSCLDGKPVKNEINSSAGY